MRQIIEIASFYMSNHEVTRGEYKAVTGIDPSKAKAYDENGKELTGDDNVKNNPVNGVNWYDVLVYCNTRSIQENLTPCYAIDGKTDPKEWGEVPEDSRYDEKWDARTCDFTADGYRLPTEAEWEWAARGGESCTYAGSDDIDKVAWYYENTRGTRDVKTKKKNGYGLYDMSGNVLEWCWDFYDYGSISSDTAATGPASGFCFYRCLRGGSWGSTAYYEQVASQFSSGPRGRDEFPPCALFHQVNSELRQA
ncbi:SUMF1/EgtB/PvdO family nonheme iron enzyme [uncultured Treponema sp.]|uniref:formylglycine-generating enzyme family protein n=1 Tax=uncultured Treponema sp. TaxID=162155 RepID=UPI00258AE5D7|nr:SUMF1/EgtB/PvdO family nonheme iron enzyme [uncultured Treponema sp.]